MTSAPTPSNSTRTTSALRGGRWKLILGVTLIALILLVVWRGPGWKAQAQTGAAYGARMGCSCHFIEGRSTDSCTADFEPGMGLVSIKADDEEKSMTAHVPLLASRTAHFSAGSGCLLDPDD